MNVPRAVLVGVLVTTGHVAAAQTRMPSDAATSARLADLRARLDRVRSARDDETVNTAPNRVPVELVGMTRDAIRAALGIPDPVDARGNGRPDYAPRLTQRHWYYSFSRLARHSRGGGPTLLLSFNARGTCTAVRWEFSR
jgi:hypothetical protein